MIENYDVKVEGGAYGLKVTKQGIFMDNLGKVHVAVCPECGYLEFYLEAVSYTHLELLLDLLQVNGKQGQEIPQSLYRFRNRDRNCDPVVMAYRKAAVIVFSNRAVQHNISGRKIKIGAVADFPLNTSLSAMMDGNIVNVVKAPWRTAGHMEIIIHDTYSGIYFIIGCCPVSRFVFHLINGTGFIPAEQIHILLREKQVASVQTEITSIL